MALPKNRQAVREILRELEPRILGREHEGHDCGCGEVHSGAAVAVKINPGGDTYPGQETSWGLWSVKMQAHSGANWHCGLSFFVKEEELGALFMRYFGDQNVDERPYRLKTDGIARVFANLPAAVRIQENDNQLRFSFSWGSDQDAARLIYELFRTSPHRLRLGSDAYFRTTSVLEALQPEIYRGGPDPELQCESVWHLDYDDALDHALATSHHIFFQNVGEAYNPQGRVFTHTDVVFMKHEVK